jgi:HTH-type transcriptional regulator/antitoxin HigA
MRKNVHEITSNLAIPPGETLRETLEAISLSQVELARRTGRPLKTINEIVQGKARITPDTAIQFERVLGISAAFWNNLETEYQETLARLRAAEALKAEEELLSEYPYAEMARLGWVPKTRVKRQKVEALLSFFSVASLKLVIDVEKATFRRGKLGTVSEEALAAWLRKGELAAESIQTAPYNATALKAMLPDLRQFTTASPQQFEKKLVGRCAECGVALVFVPHLPKTYANGAARWVGKERAIVQLSLRYRFSDVFWFTFFHEIGHLLLHGKRAFFVDTDKTEEDEREREADGFAASTLIPDKRYRDFVSKGAVTGPAVRAFAREIGIAPGIVVGRLQHDSVIPFGWLSSLRVKFKWAHDPASS